MNAIVITKNHPSVCFGQTGEIVSFNEFSDQLVFKPHGEKNKILMHYTELFDESDACDYQKLNKALSYLQ